MAVVHLIGEDSGHAIVVDRVIRLMLETHAYANDEAWVSDNLEHTLLWGGTRDLSDVVSGLRYSSMVDAKKSAKALSGVGRRISGHFNGEPATPAASAWRKLIVGAYQQGEDEPIALVIVADTDGKPGSLAGLLRAKSVFVEREPDKVIVIVAPHPEIEAWLITAFTPQDKDEAKRLVDLTKKLGLDPTKQPHRLTSDDRSPKRVLRVLLHDDNREKVLSKEEMFEATDRCLPKLTAMASPETVGIPELQKQVVERLYPLLKS